MSCVWASAMSYYEQFPCHRLTTFAPPQHRQRAHKNGACPKDDRHMRTEPLLPQRKTSCAPSHHPANRPGAISAIIKVLATTSHSPTSILLSSLLSHAICGPPQDRYARTSTSRRLSDRSGPGVNAYNPFHFTRTITRSLITPQRRVHSPNALLSNPDASRWPLQHVCLLNCG